MLTATTMNPDTIHIENHPSPPRSFYRRALPDSCVAFSSRKGRSMFESAMKTKGLKSFYNLMEQHSTQTEPAFCGVSTLVIALNALAVDPRQTWKGPWRWYEESMLNCCIDLEKIKETGITLPVFKCLAVCQGLAVRLEHVDADVDRENSKEAALERFRASVREACLETENDDKGGEITIDRILVVSYNRKILGQTGTGHFSPIAAYDQASDSVLILDTARFKYGAHWVKLPLVFEAMQPTDPDTGRSRGHVMLINPMEDTAHGKHNHHSLPIPLILRSEMGQKNARRELKEHLAGVEKAVSFNDIYNLCTRQGSNPKHIWEMTSPQLRPYNSDKDSVKMIDEVKALIQQLLPASIEESDKRSCFDGVVDECRPNRCRTLQLRPEEAIFIVYLACLDKQQREDVVNNARSSERTRNQLLAEAELLRYAIEASDE